MNEDGKVKEHWKKKYACGSLEEEEKEKLELENLIARFKYLSCAMLIANLWRKRDSVERIPFQTQELF